MSDFITKIRTAKGDKQIDYNALANLPVKTVKTTTPLSALVTNQYGDELGDLEQGNIYKHTTSNVTEGWIFCFHGRAPHVHKVQFALVPQSSGVSTTLHSRSYNMMTSTWSDWEEVSVSRSEFKSAINSLKPTPITVIPSTLEANQKYNFGEVAELSLAFPTTANDGDVVYLTFESGATATTLTIDTTNTCDIEVIPEVNTGYEIFGMYNGSIWIINYSEYTVSEG